MLHNLVLLGLAISATAAPAFNPTDLGKQCRNIVIPVTVTVPRYVVTSDIVDNWDVTSLVFNLTRRDAGYPTDPLPVEDALTEPRQSTYEISAKFCGNSSSVLVLTHGIIESHKYWQPDFPGGSEYNFVEAALAAGYSVLNYDRLGVGASSTASSFEDAQFQVQTAVLDSLVDYAHERLHANKVALVGHSYGAYLTAAAASQKSVDAIALTGFSGNLSFFGPFLAGAGLHVANTLDPVRWGHLDNGYLMSSDVYATSYIYFAEPHFDHDIARWTHHVEAEPFAIGELPSLLRTEIQYSDIQAPVLVLQGQYDLSACGGNCVGVLDNIRDLFPNAKTVEYVDNLPAGHNLNLHHGAIDAFNTIFTFLQEEGL
ncbi:Alpha/Beta hydrolase protein [Stachybotrys elegans]|uniref:Alpha/Beta hydrolase protein n=1 Tax=Stachybotrys elegans TaxID=80388 RepID=A0A8K0WP81_9HYPO|nr:Alpha/Beta hydrolase protein [Stachybotrys elegans]